MPTDAGPTPSDGERRGFPVATLLKALLPALAAPIHYNDGTRPGQRGFNGDGARRPASPEKNEVLARRVGNGLERNQEAYPVRVFADQLPVAMHDSVDRADQRRRPIHLKSRGPGGAGAPGLISR